MAEQKDRHAVPSTVIVVPVHLGVPKSEGELSGADAIAATFGVRRDTVIGWRRDGAPIVLVGNKLQAEYNALMQWLVGRDKREKG